jgi:predicted MFS family arabinose efflux permease
MQRASFWHHSFSSAMVTRVAALIGMLVLCLAVTPLGLLAGMLGLGFAQGFNYFASVYYSTTGSRQDNRGRTTGKMEAMISMGMGIGTLLGGAVGIFSLRVPYALGLGIVLVLVFVELAIYVRHIRPLMRSL